MQIIMTTPKVPVLPKQAPTASQRRSTWWGPSELQWQNYRIENVPSRTKPLLVFVNTKSGPMLGHTLRRKFLRLLNPLQVSVPSSPWGAAIHAGERTEKLNQNSETAYLRVIHAGEGVTLLYMQTGPPQLSVRHHMWQCTWIIETWVCMYVVKLAARRLVANYVALISPSLLSNRVGLARMFKATCIHLLSCCFL